MAIAKALKYGLAGLAGGLEGIAESALIQDKEEKEITRDTVKMAVAKLEKEKEQAAKDYKAQREKEKEIDSLHGLLIGTDAATGDARLLSRAEIGQLYSSVGKENLLKYALEEQRLTVGGKAERIDVAQPTHIGTEDVLSETEKAIPTGKGIAKGQAERVTQAVSAELERLGYSTEATVVPSAPVYAGGVFEIRQTDDKEIKDETVYETDNKGVPLRTLTLRTTTNKKTGAVTKEYLDGVTFEPVKLSEGANIFDNAAMAKQLASDPANPISKQGFLAIATDDGLQLIPAPGGGYQGGALMKDGGIRASVGGELQKTTYTPPEGVEGYITVVDANTFQDADSWKSVARGNKALTGTPGIEEFRKSRDEALISTQNLSALKDNSDFRLGLHAKYGDDLYSVSGGFASAVSGVSRIVEGAASVVERVIAAETPQEKMRELRMNESVLRQALTDRDNILAKVAGTEQEISTARVLDLAAANMMAYDKGKAKGEDRLTDNDFAIFQKSVLGKSATQTISLIESTYNEAVSQYAPKYDRLQADLRFATNSLRSQIKDEEQVNTMMSPYVNEANEFPSPDTLRNEMQMKLKEVRGEGEKAEDTATAPTGPAITFSSAKAGNVQLKIRGDQVSFEVEGKPATTTISLEEARALGHLSETDYQKAKAQQQANQ
jgi:hypothetical protein